MTRLCLCDMKPEDWQLLAELAHPQHPCGGSQPESRQHRPAEVGKALVYPQDLPARSSQSA